MGERWRRQRFRAKRAAVLSEQARAGRAMGRARLRDAKVQATRMERAIWVRWVVAQ
jgi:hypothetical protein